MKACKNCDTKFVKVPNLPKKRVKLALAGEPYVPFSDVLPTAEMMSVAEPLRRHADLQICHIGENVVVAAPEVYDYYKGKLSSLGFEVVKGASSLSGNYPLDIAYNIARVGDLALCLIEHTDKVVLNLLSDFGVKPVDVKQGYAKCSTAVISEGAVITADKSIARAAGANGLDVLLLRPGFVELKGYDYGFFGGCAAMIDKDLLYVNGNLDMHPDCERITEFLEKYKIKVLQGGGRLKDIGSIIPLMYY